MNCFPLPLVTFAKAEFLINSLQDLVCASSGEKVFWEIGALVSFSAYSLDMVELSTMEIVLLH